MARELYAKDDETYRVRIVWATKDGRSFEQIFGPYKTLGTARGVLTQKTARRGYSYWTDPIATIEHAKYEWEVVNV